MEQLILPRAERQEIHGHIFSSWFDLSRRLELFDYLCGHGIELEYSIIGITMDGNTYGYEGSDSLASDTDFVCRAEATPDEVRDLIENFGSAQPWDYMPFYMAMLDELLSEQLNYDDATESILLLSTKRLAAEVAQWFAWSRLPSELCVIIGEYLLPVDDWFERRLELALEIAGSYVKGTNR